MTSVTFAARARLSLVLPLSILVLAIASAGCTPGPGIPDTCVVDTSDDASDDNMANPNAPSGLTDNGDGTHTLLIAWESVSDGVAAELGSDYFEPVRFEGTAAITSLEKTGEREITVHFSGLLNELNPEDQALVRVFFDDRRHHVSCDHPGMDDEYLLDVLLDFDAAGTLVSIEFDQRRNLGAI